MKIDWKRKLTSRKFWLAIALFVSGVLTATGNGEKAETVTGLIMQAAAVIAYIIGEGLSDNSNIMIDYKPDIIHEEEEKNGKA